MLAPLNALSGDSQVRARIAASKRAMGSGKCVAHSEAPAPSPKPKKRYRSPERTCYGGDGSKECPILLDSPLWLKDHKDMKKLLARWVE